ncbi:hypothetical protein [Streptomyces sp. NPDC059247]|uniref:hypothetical protein n=1 Tax=Streptomyces sp. NPDC059247 TaxID=3346790 RepID=UPI00368EFC37
MWTRLAARQRQRRLVDQAVGAEHRQLRLVGPLRRGIVPIAAGLVLCVVAVGAIVLGLRAVDVDEQQAARATRTEAEVTGHTDMSLRIRTHDGRRITVDAFLPEDYGLGDTVTVLEDERWRRLAAEPYDAFGWQLLALVVGLPGLSLLTTGLLARRRGAALRRGSVPALRVLARLDHHAWTWVYAADDTDGSTPLFSCTGIPVLLDADEREEPCTEIDVVHVVHVIEELPVVEGKLREAVMLGAPYDGGELAFITMGADGIRGVTHAIGPVRLPRGGEGSRGRLLRT